MLIISLVLLAAGSAAYIFMRQRNRVWQSWVILGAVAIWAWLLSVGSFALAVDNKTGPDDEIAFISKILIAGFFLYPVVLWMAANSFAKGRRL